MEAVVEIINKGRMARYQVFNQANIKVGRAYNNDIILADPYVCPLHMEFQWRDGGWQIVDRSEKNGTFDGKTGSSIDHRKVQFGDEFLLGKTKLKFLSVESPIEPTWVMHRISGAIKWVSNSPGVLLLMFAFLGYLIWQAFIGSAFEFQFEQVLTKQLTLVFLPLMWAALWGLLGRVLHHDSQIFAHAAVSYLAVLMLFLKDEVIAWVGYLLSNSWLMTGASLAFTGGIVAWALSKNMLFATEVNKKKRWVIAGFGACCLVMVLFLSAYSSLKQFHPAPIYNYALMPPVLNWRQGVAETQFLTESQAVFEEVMDSLED